MDEKSLELLEFDAAKGKVARFASFALSRDALLALKPLTNRRRVEERLQESAEARKLLSLLPAFSLGHIEDIRPAAALAAQGHVLQAVDLVAAARTLEAVAEARHEIADVKQQAPRLWAIAEVMSDLRPLARDITKGISSSGDILDSASPRLTDIRRRLIEARRDIIENLETYMATQDGQGLVTDHVVTQREGRYVIPVKAEYRRTVQGIVHDVSNSGATVFMEPWNTVEQGNALRELEAGERGEILRILQERSETLGSHRAEIERDIPSMTALDVAVAKARYALEERAIEPILLDEKNRSGQGTRLDLRQARHPLLGPGAVPVSLKLGDGFRVLVVTGPNTGGKTVLLKTVGLLAAMAQSGFPIPVGEGTVLPVFDQIFADIGDEQSIAQTLSTFSWHIGNVVRIVSNATEHSLVLLDEPGSATDPAEGSALARALLQRFLENGALTLAATHYTDVKVFAHATPGLQNASLEFDAVTNRPTFRLQMGFPGVSNALATAERLGLPADLVENARQMLPKAERDLAELLSDLEADRRAVEDQKASLADEAAVVENLRLALEAELARIENEDRLAAREARDSVSREAAVLHRQIREVAAELKRSRNKEQLEQARTTLGVVQAKLRSEDMQVPAPTEARETDAIVDEDLRPGDIVRIRGTSTEATVVSVSEKTFQIEVQCASVRMWLGANSVDKIAASTKRVEGAVSLKLRKLDRDVPRELDLRGKRADEIEPALDSYFNAATMAHLPSVRIIHGFGTGTVRTIVRDYLKGYRLVSSFRPGEQSEGGDGVTVAEL
jgi:DNA mismatch repair protein MutS2